MRNRGFFPEGVDPCWMYLSIASAKACGFLLYNSLSIGLREGTDPSSEPGFGILPVPFGPWQAAHCLSKSNPPWSGLPIMLAAGPDESLAAETCAPGAGVPSGTD